MADVKSWMESNSGFTERLTELVGTFASRREAASVAGVTDEQLRKWLKGAAKVPFGSVAQMALEKKFSLDWVAHGVGEKSSELKGKDVAGPSDGDRHRQLVWNVAYALAKETKAFGKKPDAFADSFIDLVDYAEQTEPEKTAAVVDFEAKRLLRRGGDGS